MRRQGCDYREPSTTPSISQGMYIAGCFFVAKSLLLPFTPILPVPIPLPTNLIILRLLLKKWPPNGPRHSLRNKPLDRRSRMKPIPPQTAHPIWVHASRIRGPVCCRVAQRKVKRRLCIENRRFCFLVLGGEVLHAIYQKDVVRVGGGAQKWGGWREVSRTFLNRCLSSSLARQIITHQREAWGRSAYAEDPGKQNSSLQHHTTPAPGQNNYPAPFLSTSACRAGKR